MRYKSGELPLDPCKCPNFNELRKNDRLGTNAKATEKTPSSGAYTIPNLQPGDCTVDVQATGFSQFEEQVHVERLAQVGLNISLKVGTQSEKVTINAEQEPMMNTVNGQVEDVIPAESGFLHIGHNPLRKSH